MNINNWSPEERLRLYFWATALLGLGILFYGLGSIPLLSFNEARRGIPIQTMAEGGDWLIPELNGQVYINKPPLFYWLGTVAAWLFGGVDEWTIRLPSALSAAGLLGAVYLLARRIANPWIGLLAVIMLITNLSFTMFARRAEIEMLLTALCAGSLFAAYAFILDARPGYMLYLSYLLLGLAVLTKGPVALLFVIPPVIGYALVYRDPRAYAYLRALRGWLLMLVVALPWYLLVAGKLGLDAWMPVVNTDIVGKISQHKADPIYDYLMWVAGDFFPWSLLAILAPLAAVRAWKASPRTLFLLLAAVIPLVVLSLFSNKHAKYLLPAYPAMAILLAWLARDGLASCRPYWRKAMYAAVAIIPPCFLLYYAVAEARVYSYRYSAFPQIVAARQAHPDSPLFAYREVDERVIYYLGQPVRVIDEQAALELGRRENALLLGQADAPQQALEQAGWCVLGTIEPYLKKGKSARLYAAGSACPKGENGAAGI